MTGKVNEFGNSLRVRPSARIIVLDRDGRILLFRFDVPDRAPFWCTPGGECDAGEPFEDAARRELREETGLDLDCGVQIARTTPQFVTPEGEKVQADERYFVVHTDVEHIDTSGHTPLERRVMTRHRWFTRDDLANWSEAVFPANLADMIDEAARHTNQGCKT